jgi:hypothetical protein
MNRPILIAAAVLLAALPVSADDVVRTLSQRYPTGGAQSVALDVPVGELIVNASDQDQVNVDVRLECDRGKDRCADLAKNVKLVGSNRGDRLRVEIDGWPKGNHDGLEAHVRVSMPRGLALNADLGVGKLQVSGIEDDITADVGVGEISVTSPASAVRSVHLDSGVGDARLRASGKSLNGAGMVGKELDWDKGAGSAALKLDCGVGDIEVSLQ